MDVSEKAESNARKTSAVDKELEKGKTKYIFM
jgi:hypothetical protein